MSSVIDGIESKLDALPGLVEVDAHIGSYVRQLSRFQTAYDALVNHAKGLEAQVEELVNQAAGHVALIDHLKGQVKAQEPETGPENQSPAS